MSRLEYKHGKAMDWKIRLMRGSDLPGVMEIQRQAYLQFVESESVLASKWRLSADTSFVGEMDGRLIGYLIAHPSRLLEPVALHTELACLPEAPDCLYLHDLAISPEAKGRGVANALVQSFLHGLRVGPYHVASLIAVQNSQSFWEKQGFRPFEMSPELSVKLESYGEGACYMIYGDLKYTVSV